MDHADHVNLLRPGIDVAGQIVVNRLISRLTSIEDSQVCAFCLLAASTWMASCDASKR